MRKGTLSDAIAMVTTMDIVESFGVPYEEKRGKIYLLCPGHDDRHFGSCYIDKNDDGYYCYVCSEHVPKWEMVLLLNGRNKTEAAKWFFQMAGLTPVKENKQDPYKKAQRLIKKVNQYVNNKPIYSDIKSCDKIESSYGRNINGEYLYSELSVTDPLVDIYKKDKHAFQEFVCQLLETKKKKFNRALQKFQHSKNGDGMYVEINGESTLICYSELIDACQEKIQNIDKLIEEVNAL